MIYLISSIKEITKDKIKFLDQDDVIQEIDLQECSKNWVVHFNNHDYKTWGGNPAPNIDISDFEVLSLSQEDKLFKIL